MYVFCVARQAGHGLTVYGAGAWYGTAPVCEGECPAGTVQVTTDDFGDGFKCYSGNKVFCCPRESVRCDVKLVLTRTLLESLKKRPTRLELAIANLGSGESHV